MDQIDEKLINSYPYGVKVHKIYSLNYPVVDNFLEEDFISEVKLISVKDKFIIKDKLGQLEELVESYNNNLDIREMLINKISLKIENKFWKIDSNIFNTLSDIKKNTNYENMYNEYEKLYNIELNNLKNDCLLYEILAECKNKFNKNFKIKTDFIKKTYLEIS